MIATISKDFTWSASHQLEGLAEGHPCGRVHGHNYVAKVIITGTVDPATGFVVDYGELKPFGAWIDEHWDHRHLNDVTHQPTAEHLAALLLDYLRGMLGPRRTRQLTCIGVSVSETPKTWATVEETW